MITEFSHENSKPHRESQITTHLFKPWPFYHALNKINQHFLGDFRAYSAP